MLSRWKSKEQTNMWIMWNSFIQMNTQTYLIIIKYYLLLVWSMNVVRYYFKFFFLFLSSKLNVIHPENAVVDSINILNFLLTSIDTEIEWNREIRDQKPIIFAFQIVTFICSIRIQQIFSLVRNVVQFTRLLLNSF